MKGLLVALCATIAGAAHAQSTSGSLQGGGGGAGAVQTQQVSVNVGSEDFAGYGGFVPLGLSGSLTIVNEKNGSGASATDLAINTDLDGTTGQIVPCTQASLTCTAYGTAGPTFNGPYTLTVTGTGGTRLVTVNIVSSRSDIKSQYGFATHGDAAGASAQLSKVFTTAGAIHLGDTVVMRNGAGTSGITPGFNPTCASRLAIAWIGGWSGAGRIILTSDVQTATSDTNGRPIYGGAQVCDLESSGFTAGDVVTPIDIEYLSFYNNSPSPSNTAQLSFQSNSHGVNVYYSNFQVGPLIGTAPGTLSGLDGIGYAYAGSDTVANASPTFDHNYINGYNVGISVSGSGATIPGPTISNSNILNSVQKGIILDLDAPSIIAGNFFSGGFSVGGNHGDNIIFQLQSVGYSGAGPTITKNIIVHGPAGLTAVGSVNYSSASGTAISNGTYSQLATTGGAGLYAYLDLTVSGCPGACAYTATPTAFAGGGTQGGGRGYLVGDTISVTQTTLMVNFTVASLTYSPDALGIFVGGTGIDVVSSFVAQNNIVLTVDGGQIEISDASGIVVNYNDTPGDFVSYPALWTTVGTILATGTAGGSFDRNTTNVFAISGQSGLPTCYPGTPTACAASTVAVSGTAPTFTGTLANYQAIWPNFTTTPALYNRAAFILSQAPLLGGAGENPDGTYRTALFPVDSHGVISWNDGTVFVFTATHTPAQ